MTVTKIWQRMLFFRALKFILFFLAAIYTIYVVIDLSAHSGRLFSSSCTLIDLFFYYVHHFMAHLDLFLPLSLLLATISLLSSMNLHHEIVSLRMAGISLRKFSLPLLILSFFLSFFSYINYEYIAPSSLDYIENFKESHLRRNKEVPSLTTAPLLDGSKIIFQNYDKQKNELFDLFWVRSHSDIWHMKYFSLDNNEGRFVDHLVKNENNLLLEKKESYDSHPFSEISIPDIENGKNFLFEKENFSISALLKEKNFLSLSDKASVLSHLYYKMALPLLSPLIVLALVPFCVKFSKNLHVFFLTTVALFCFFTFITLMDSCVILGENQVVRPLLVLWGPIFSLYLVFGWRFLQTKQ